jgi:ribosomal protein RSM22 (predicted rRNA methylase)
LGELPERARESLLRRAWQSAQQALLIVEPGTKHGFAVVRGAREFLLNTGANLAAPCPHHQECPMAAGGGVSGRRGRGDWCHFAQRVERTSMHRLLKSGVLGHEDEKFCYVAATPGSLRVPVARIVRHPQRHSGHVQLMLCTRQGLLRTIVTKSQKSIYKEARKAGWGDAWNLS